VRERSVSVESGSLVSFCSALLLRGASAAFTDSGMTSLSTPVVRTVLKKFRNDI
jgi:hypothetical protein